LLFKLNHQELSYIGGSIAVFEVFVLWMSIISVFSYLVISIVITLISLETVLEYLPIPLIIFLFIFFTSVNSITGSIE
jgi:hypothetical protein